MAILLYGLNHVSAPLAVRERAAFLADEIPAAAARLVTDGGAQEAMILSTCNRTELLAHAASADAGAALREFLLRERRLDPQEADRHCYLHREAEAVRHLFRTAASLDSLVVGEPQILGQMKDAYGAAVRGGALGTVLEGLVQRSFAVAKRVRRETGIGRASVSVGSVAAGLARNIFGDLGGIAIVILGSGEMARLAAEHLIGDGVRSLVVCGRSLERAGDLARLLGGSAVPFDERHAAMERADVVITSTAAPHHVVSYDDVVRLGRARRGRPLFFIDIAVPRDVDPRVNGIDNVYLYDIDDLRSVARSNLDGRRQESAAAEEIVEREASSYLARRDSLDVAPAIVELRQHLHGLGSAELARFRSRLGDLSPGQERALEEMTAALINKFLHRPTVAIRQAAAQNGSGGLRLRLMRELFGLDATNRDDDGQ